MYRKLFCMLAVCAALFTGAGAAQTAFPAAETAVDGVTRYGYLDETGQTVLAFAYAQAGDFAPCGLAAVEDDKWQTAVIDRTGRLVVPYTEAPVSVDFSDEAIAYRYAGYTVFYDLTGAQLGVYEGAEGFFADGLLLVKSAEDGLYRYVGADGQPAFDAAFRDAGAFANGLAVVREAESGLWTVIDTAGTPLVTLPRELTPAYLAVYQGDVLVVTDGANSALYSIAQNALFTGFSYGAISEFHEDGAAMVRLGNLWGLMDISGAYRTAPTYYYLSYMGEGLYAARSQDGSASAVDADGNLTYRTPTYVGGFTELRYGLSWHGMADGSIIFFRKNGGYYASLKNAENPLLLTENVVRVTQDGKTRYINLSNNAVLHEQPTVFRLGQGVTAETQHYEKFLGYQADGSEHGWNVDFPEIHGMTDEQLQKDVNAAIRTFFLTGPSSTAEYDALEGSYGVSLEGSVLVVWANCVSGKGEGAGVWNNSLAFDLNTGAQYTLNDLMTRDYMDTVKALLPNDRAIYLYSFPRISAKGVTYFYNEYESAARRAYTESFLLTFDQLGDAVDRESDCFRALNTTYLPPTAGPFPDVTEAHWAYAYIGTVYERGLMRGGTDGLFRPSDSITTAEVCATIARLEALETPETLMDGIAPDAWYADELSAVAAAGLLDGLPTALDPTQPMTRADAMQLFSNVLLHRDAAGETAEAAPAAETGAEAVEPAAPLLTEQEIADALAAFADADTLPADRRTAAAHCIRQGLIEGANGLLSPQGYFTRAQFAKLLSLL